MKVLIFTADRRELRRVTSHQPLTPLAISLQCENLSALWGISKDKIRWYPAKRSADKEMK
jgi:hypothetical protein